MPAPTASPSVSSTVGLKNMVIAPLTEDTEEGTTYGTLQAWRGRSRLPLPPRAPTPTSSTPTTCALLPDNLRRNAQ